MEITQYKPKIYVESSTISYLTARPTEEPLRKAKQILTRMWWEQRERYDLYISQTVIEEIEKGDKTAATLRMRAVKGLPILERTPVIVPLAQTLLQVGVIPLKEDADATHIAYAAVHGMDFLITWNQKHIAKDTKRRWVEAILYNFGLKPPRLLTPESYLLEWGDENVHGY